MMNRKVKNILLPIVAIAFVLGGCTKYSKVMSSGNQELMYKTAWELYNGKKYSKVIALTEQISPYYTGTEREDSVVYLSAASNYKVGNFETSELMCDLFRRRFLRSPFIEDIEYMYAKGYYYLSPQSNRDQTNTKIAITNITEYLERYPNSIKKDELNNNIVELRGKLYDKAFSNAKVYYKIEHYKSASIALRNAVDEYPETPHLEELLYLITKSDYLLASNSVESLKKDRFLNMMDAYYTLASEYPQSKYIKEVDKMMETAKNFTSKKGGIEAETEK